MSKKTKQKKKIITYFERKLYCSKGPCGKFVQGPPSHLLRHWQQTTVNDVKCMTRLVSQSHWPLTSRKRSASFLEGCVLPLQNFLSGCASEIIPPHQKFLEPRLQWFFAYFRLRVLHPPSHGNLRAVFFPYYTIPLLRLRFFALRLLTISELKPFHGKGIRICG